MPKSDKNLKLGDRQLKKTIDMITRLYVHVIKSEDQISASEIDILYSLLINLFRDVNISWEVYVRNIMETEDDFGQISQYLNQHLNVLDKIRIILSLIILANTDNSIEISELTGIIALCRKFELSPEPFVELMDHFESGIQECVAIPHDIQYQHLQDSLFTDYVSIGSSSLADMRFKDPGIGELDCILFGIDKSLFLSTSFSCTSKLNGLDLKPSCVILLPPEGTLEVRGLAYDIESLWKIYRVAEDDDDIEFKKPDYDFLISRHRHQYSILVNGGTITVNDKELVHGRKLELFYDDVLQIQGYAKFTVRDVIRERSSIGIDTMVPRELFLIAERDFFYLSRVETERAIARIEVEKGKFYLHPPKRGWTIFHNQQRVKELTQFKLNTDILTIARRNFRINGFYDLVETPFEVQSLTIQDVKHYFQDGKLALDGISCNIRKGELIGILGQSGCGKSTLVKTITSELVPTYGQVKIDGKVLYNNLSYYSQFFGYVPQDDLLYPNLTVYENLWYRGRLRLPNISAASLKQKIENLLHQVNLSHRKDTQVGEPRRTMLSGGERKRLNVALELLFEPTVIVCDEPTSGLSWGDAEQVIDILKLLTAQGKIVILTIHQPNSSVFRKFNQVLLMDLGGRQAFFGPPDECFDYFDYELAQLGYRREDIERKKQLHNSDYMYEVITYPQYDDSNAPVYEQVNKLLQVKRKFPPEYWRDKYKRKMLFEIIQLEPADPPARTSIPKRRHRKLDFRSRLVHLLAFITRSLTMKLRNRTNNLITFVEAPLLGLVISFILRHTPRSGPYNYNDNNNIGIFIFVSIIAFMFMGMSNSVEEILSERKIILREKLMNLKVSFYLASKLIALTFFSLVQVLLYVLVASLVLEIKGMWGISILYLLLTSIVGFSLGLTVSSFLKDNKSIINLLPLLLIPQIILGGAVIEYERMNRRLTLLERHPVPEVVQLIPSRWIFEGLTTAYAKNTVFHRKLAEIEKKRLTYNAMFKDNRLDAAQYRKLIAGISNQRDYVADKWDPTKVTNANLNASVGLMDGQFHVDRRNVFLSSYKLIKGKIHRTWNYNVLMILLYVLGFNLITILKLKYYFKE
ncbi:MAG: ATP-binding cassette domain-containing protein [Candidatus Cloacimonetes bacterium]|nr:ATP-binding cassette domain-containing protein [Candidatus Cloacimonadota bacterium]